MHVQQSPGEWLKSKPLVVVAISELVSILQGQGGILKATKKNSGGRTINARRTISVLNS